ncbi:MAG: C39 family peptidase [Lachnospiraceae bacterium]|nr:C39 family peptidase [Lachnospiraceae bacterium]
MNRKKNTEYDLEESFDGFEGNESSEKEGFFKLGNVFEKGSLSKGGSGKEKSSGKNGSSKKGISIGRKKQKRRYSSLRQEKESVKQGNFEPDGITWYDDSEEDTSYESDAGYKDEYRDDHREDDGDGSYQNNRRDNQNYNGNVKRKQLVEFFDDDYDDYEDEYRDEPDREESNEESFYDDSYDDFVEEEDSYDKKDVPVNGAKGARERRNLKNKKKKKIKLFKFLIELLACVLVFFILFQVGYHSHGGDGLESFNSGIKDLTGQYVELPLIEAAFSKELPYLMQSDKRWRNFEYAGSILKDAGGGPTCMSMVSLYLTNNKRFNPRKVAKYIIKGGYIRKNNTLSPDFMTDGCFRFGLIGTEIEINDETFDTMKSELKAGHPIIASVSGDDFSATDGFIVITKCSGNKFKIKDPASLGNTKKSWSYNKLKSQIKKVWSYQAYAKFYE